MKFYLKQNVFEAALDRIRYLFDEFPNIIVNTSGGKDSTVTLNLALQVAEEKGRLPLKVMFIDQEAEWQCVIDHIREVMADPRVDPIWLQVPIRLFNATSTLEPWLFCWEEGKQWIREKEPNSLHVNKYGTDRFAKMFEAYCLTEYPNQPVIHLAGVRCEESPARTQGLTVYPCYKGITWGRKEDAKRGHYTFYPLYDWSYTDVWKAIHDNGWPYCPIYDQMYRYGVPLPTMRVSNVHHETAVTALFFLQEIEPETWEKISGRLAGINTAGHMARNFFTPTELPFMFGDWKEYRDHLLDNLVTDTKWREKMRKSFASEERRYDPRIHDKLIKMHINVILCNDWEGTKQSTFSAANGKWLINGRYGNGSNSVSGTRTASG